MPELRTIKLVIAGRVYHIKSKDDDAYLINLAKMVNDRMREVAQSTNTVDSLRVADMAALNLADAFCKLRDEYEQRIRAMDQERDRLQSLIDNALND